jgi:hypothetical protein
MYETQCVNAPQKSSTAFARAAEQARKAASTAEKARQELEAKVVTLVGPTPGIVPQEAPPEVPGVRGEIEFAIDRIQRSLSAILDMAQFL